VNLGIGLILVIGTFLSFLPQHFSIIYRRSHIGLSLFTLWLFPISNVCNTMNAILDDWEGVMCCSKLDPWECFVNILVIDQLVVNAFCQTFVFILALMFYEHDGSRASARLKLAAQLGFLFFCVFALVVTYVGVVLVELLGPHHHATVAYSYSLGIFSAVGPALTWTTQIWVTYKLKSAGSFSIISLVIQCPGTGLQALFQGILNGDLVVALPNTVGFVEQLILLIMCLYYELRTQRSLGWPRITRVMNFFRKAKEKCRRMITGDKMIEKTEERARLNRDSIQDGEIDGLSINVSKE